MGAGQGPPARETPQGPRSQDAVSLAADCLAPDFSPLPTGHPAAHAGPACRSPRLLTGLEPGDHGVLPDTWAAGVAASPPAWHPETDPVCPCTQVCGQNRPASRRTWKCPSAEVWGAGNWGADVSMVTGAWIQLLQLEPASEAAKHENSHIPGPASCWRLLLEQPQIWGAADNP